MAVDWDGTLVEYNGYKGVGVYGAPVPKMVNRIKRWLSKGTEVIIFTSRVSVEHDMDRAMDELEAIQATLHSMGLPILEVTANKLTRINQFWDDRAVRVMRNTGIIGHEDLGTIRGS